MKDCTQSAPVLKCCGGEAMIAEWIESQDTIIVFLIKFSVTLDVYKVYRQ